MNARSLRMVVVALFALGITFAVVYGEQFDAATLQAWIDNAGVTGPLLFLLVYTLGTVLFLPGSVATLAFLVARYLAADWVENKASGPLDQNAGRDDGVSLFMENVRLDCGCLLAKGFWMGRHT